MEYYIRIVALGLILFLGCHKPAVDPSSCQVNNPLTDLPWLKTIATDNKLPYLQIEQGKYQSRTVYIVRTCGLCFAGGIATIYQCDGTEICHFGTSVLEPNPSCKQIDEKEISSRNVLLTK